ncbi:YceI family protein [Microbulbifer flavimaris]|uniref:YceI family protein n=2 Tax=Microbulbiferaceae TaxID=1706373 RepID=A0ABX4I290_9GAMM|nr:YceI family protein [Microbulbifer flavimaris]
MFMGLFSSHLVAEQVLPLSAASDIHWRVYRSGPMAHLGHNHVIRATNIRGSVTLRDATQLSEFTLEIPLQRLEVDPPALRRRYGREFSSQLSSEDIAGTRANMLGERQLQASRFPTIRLTGKARLSDVSAAQKVLIAARLHLRGRIIPLRLPATVTVSSGSVRASGSFSLSHAQLGLEPFSVALGALRVGERIDFSFDIRTR